MASGAPPRVRILGRSGSGKTTLIEKLIQKLHPLRIGVIKHTRHHLDLPENTKDTTRYATAGAMFAGGLSANEAELFVRVPLEIDRLIEMMTGYVDLILIEGARGLDLPTIVVGEAPADACLKQVLATVPRYPPVTPELTRLLSDLAR